MKKSSMKFKKYLAGIILVLVLITLIGLLRFGNLDKLKGKIKIKDVYLSNISTKLNANVLDASGEGPVVSNGYDEVSYELKYRLSDSDQRRNVIITGSLDSDNGYASFKKLVGDNITSTLSNDNRNIEIVISNVPANTEITTNIALTINGAPNGYKVNPTFKIKETTAEEYTNFYTNPIEISTNNLRGTVINENGDKISDIIVSVFKNKKLIKETYTNSNGEYIISDLPEDSYTIRINEEIYKDPAIENVIVKGDTILNLSTERIYPFELKIHKYITKVDANNLGSLISKTYDRVSTVAFPIKKLTNLNGKVYYSIVVENTGEKEGIVSAVKDELPDYMEFDENENDGFELKNGYIYDRNLEGITLRPGEKVEDTLVLRIKNTNEARTYLNRVNALGEIYEHVVYILDGRTYKEEDVLEGEKTERPTDPVENFSGWYTDSEFTNKYNFNNLVTKDLILYGKTGQKYNVDFYDKDPETGDEELYTKKTVDGGKPVDEPNDHPEHTGYDFDYWCTTDFVEYNFNLPVNSDLKLINCTTIKKYDVNFYNYQDTIEKNVKIEYKKLVSQSDAPVLTEDAGYVFVCWTEDKQNCFDFTTPIVKKTDLYPKHEQLTNSVIFDDLGRTTVKENIPYGNTVEPVDNQGWEGHTFKCWSEDRINCFDFNTPIIENKTLYAEYDINKYTVHFIDRNPETLEEIQYGENQIIEWGGTATRPENDPYHYGYTFDSWEKDGTTYDFNTQVKSDITLVSDYNINSYPVNFHNDNDVTTVNVVYKNKVTPITSPTKEHHIFNAWLLENDTVFDFDTPIIEETDLYSNFEEVLPPSISHDPTMWTNQNVTVTLSDNPLLVDNTGYSYLYKTTTTDYGTYTAPFTVDENTTIIAKGMKSDVDSVVTNHEIVNIDKLNPSVTLLSENSVTKNTASLNITVLDNESGVNYYEVYQDNVKVGERHFECYDKNTYDEYEACRSSLPTERATVYPVSNLNASTTYIFKVKVFDKAGNYAWSDEIEVTTPTPRIVARLIGYNNNLFTDTVDDTTGDVIVPKEDKFINFESLAEAFDYEDLYDCKHVQCTIQMVTSTNESVEVLAGQNLTLDLNGKIVSGVNEEYTIKNNGDFTLIESTPETEDPGKLVNNLGIALLNKNDCHFTMGSGYSDIPVNTSVVSQTRPYIYGETVGVKSEANAYFTIFDGKVVAPVSQTPGLGAVNGKVTGTEYSYEAVSNNSTIDGREYQVVSLSQLVSPEARVNQSVYYAKLATAMNKANGGTITETPSENPKNLMGELRPYGDNSFVYDSDLGVWRTNVGNNSQSTKAISYMIVDLTNESSDKSLSIDYDLRDAKQKDYLTRTGSYYQNPFGGYGTDARPAYIHANVYNGRNSEGANVEPYNRSLNNYSFELKKGEMYIIYFEHHNCGSNGYGDMFIDNITLSDIEINTNKVTPQSDLSVTSYSFYYDEHDKKIKSENQYVPGASTAYGYIELDLTDKEGYYNLVVDAHLEAYTDYINYNDNIKAEARVVLSENPSISSGSFYQYFYVNNPGDVDVPREGLDRNAGDYGGWELRGPGLGSPYSQLEGGKKYYLQFVYFKYAKNSDNYPTREEYEAAGCKDQFIIDTIDLIKVNDDNKSYIEANFEPVENTIMEDLVESSNGGLTLSDDGGFQTNFNGPDQKTNSSVTIDLREKQNGIVIFTEMDLLKASSAFYIYTSVGSQTYSSNITLNSQYNYNTQNNLNNVPTCTNCFKVFQKRTYNGSESYIEVGGSSENREYNSSTGEIKAYYVYSLTPGYEYELVFNTMTISNSMETYPNIKVKKFEVKELTTFQGNYYDGVSGSAPKWLKGTITPGEYYFTSLATSYPQQDLYKDSFIKIDLTGYDKNQFLRFDRQDDTSFGDYYIYLTNNNRALSEDELYRNRSKIIEYTLSGSSSGQSPGIVLEKGKVYYVHFAEKAKFWYGTPRSLTSYSLELKNISLTPVDETVVAIGTPTIFTGTYDVVGIREEFNTIPKRTSDEPIISNGNTIHDFTYNEETGWYDAQNSTVGSVAGKLFKIDLTEASENKIYNIQTNGGGKRNVYTISDSENIASIDINKYKNSYSDEFVPANYSEIKNSINVELEKGKVHYIQLFTYKEYSDTNPLSIKVTEVNTTNTSNEYNTIDEIYEFNTKVDTVQLLKDVVAEQPVNVDPAKEVILDLNGYNLSSSAEFVITNQGNLTIDDTKYARTVATYERDLAEYQEYAGLCDGCSPSAEYILDHNISHDFTYTGNYQEYVVPYTGTYKLQVWGAQGGYRSNSSNGGKGGYSEGLIELQKDEVIYVYVGGSGNTGGTSGGFNGGGTRGSYYGGGGATDIRVEGNSLYNRIIVAGGGGSDGAATKPGGVGGGLSGTAATSGYGTGGTAGTQTAAGTSGSFGQGGKGVNKSSGYGGAGGGGWYGGGGTTPDGSGDDDKGGGGGSGFVYTDSSTLPVEGYLVENHILTSAITYSGNESFPNHNGSGSMTGNTGNGFAKITCVYSDEMDEIKNNLPKTYNVKVQPDISSGPAGLTNNNGAGIIKNGTNSTLKIKNVKLNVSTKYGIYNLGTVETYDSPTITVSNISSTGIANGFYGNIVNNGDLNIVINTGCNANNLIGATAISYDGGNHDISNVNITGKNGSGIVVQKDTNVNIHSSNINIGSDLCSNTVEYNNNEDYTETSSYDKNFGYKRYMRYDRYGRSLYDRLDGTVLNFGNTHIDQGTSLVGQVTNIGNLHLSDGTSFNDIYQIDGYRVDTGYTTYTFDNINLYIYNTVANVNKIINQKGTINIIEEDGQNSVLTSSTTPTILNFDTVNTTGGEISSIYNMGELNSNNTDFSKLYNLHTFLKTNSSIDRLYLNGPNYYKGVANLTGGSITDSELINEYHMTLDGVNVQNGILNRGDLNVKGNSTVTGTDKVAINNIPITLRYYAGDGTTFGYLKTSVTIGDNDSNVTTEPSITSTGSNYAITGDCNSKGTTVIEDFEFNYTNSKLQYSATNDPNGIGYYLDSEGYYVNAKNTAIKEKMRYPENANNLCEINYYDGKIQNTTVTDMTDVVDIPIKEIASGYDVLYDNSDLVGKVTLDTIDSSSRSDVIDISGTPYKSLQAAISSAADNSIINVTGNYNTANKVVIPADKNLTINYAAGSRINSYSKDPLITNNGGLTLIGDGTNNIIGITAYENNNNMIINGSNNTNNVDNYDTQKNLIINNSNLTINDITSNGLDIISKTDAEEGTNTLAINNGVFKSNTIYGNKSNITLTGGYFDTDTNNNYYEIASSGTPVHTKPLFNVNESIVNINNLDVDNDTRYSSITDEQNLGRFDNASTLNLNNSKFGGKTSDEIYTAIQGVSTININNGTYNNLHVHLRGDSNNYNQLSGIVNGTLFITNTDSAHPIAKSNTVNIVSGKLISPNESAIDLINATGTDVVIGTKGDINPETNQLIVSKTDPEIKGATYGISAGGTTDSSRPNNLYFYDGIFKGDGNPIDFHVKELETGYDISFNRNKIPKEKYLDILPFILNYTTGTYYFDIQAAFNEANTDDELIWIKDYTNFANSPSLVINQNKKFKLYFSYIKKEETPIYQTAYGCYYFPSEECDIISGTPQDEFKPYRGEDSIPSGYTVFAPFININNNEVAVDAATGETEKAPFIINNGDVEFISAATASSGNTGSLSIPSNFESVSGTAIVKNNGTISLNGITAVNVKALGTMFKNNGTMNIVHGHFETIQATILDNYGELNITGDENDSSLCFKSTYMKVHRTDDLENTYKDRSKYATFDPHSLFRESIINNENATMNISYLYYNSDYLFVPILNNGTMHGNNVTIEGYRDDKYAETIGIGNTIINNGTMQLGSSSSLATKGILNNGELTYSGTVDGGFDDSITNNGTLVFTGTISGAARGIYDTGDTDIPGAGITTYREAYYGTGSGTVSMLGGFNSYGKSVTNYSVSYEPYTSCSNGTAIKTTISGTLKNPETSPYPFNTGVIYVSNRTLNISSSGVSFAGNLTNVTHSNYGCTKDGTYYEKCPAPYTHENTSSNTSLENGNNYTIAAVEAQNAVVNFNSGSINGVSGNNYTFGIYSRFSTINQNGGYISNMYINNVNEAVNLGIKDGDMSDGLIHDDNIKCSPSFKGLNFYDGSIGIDATDRSCHFADKEDDYIIFKPDSYYVLNNPNYVENISTGVPYSSFRQAVSEASAGDTLKLLFTVSYPTNDYDIEVDKDLTIDLNNNYLDANILITGGNVTIDNNGTTVKGKVSEVTNTGGTVNINKGIVTKSTNSSIFNQTGGTVTKLINTATGTANISYLAYNNYLQLNTIDNAGILNITDPSDGYKGYISISNINNTGTTNATHININGTTITNTGTGLSTLSDADVKTVVIRENSSLEMDSDCHITNLNCNAPYTNPITVNGGTIDNIYISGTVTLNNVISTGEVSSEGAGGTITINSGIYNKVNNYSFLTINNGNITTLQNNVIWDATINNGTIGTVTNKGNLYVLGGELGKITNEGQLIIGEKDGIVNTNSPRISTLANNTYAINSPSNYTVKYYDGIFTSRMNIVINATITDIEDGYTVYTAPDYDELGNLTGTYSMTLRQVVDVDTKIACVEGICYESLQEAIDASVRNYNEDDGCPEVRIGDDFYFSVELDEDLVLDPQYTVSVNLNYHNLNDNGHNIPDNITLRNGSRNGTDLQSSLSKFLGNVLGTNDTSKNVIITKMADGNALDTSKTYKLYRYETGSYLPVKVSSESAGHYSIGKDTLELKSIKGRVYIDDLSTGDYMLKDNYDNELEFNVYENGTLSQNIKENNSNNNYGRLTASAIATLIVTIQTGITRYGYILLGMMFIIVIITALLLYRKNKSMKETI